MPEAKILIVDDEEIIRLMLNKGLQKEGYSIEEASNGKSALEKLNDFEPDIILLDVHLPGVAGNYLIEKIKESKPNIQIIMVTGMDQEAMKIESYFKGAFDFIEKPVDLPYLKSTIKRALDYQKNKLT